MTIKVSGRLVIQVIEVFIRVLALLMVILESFWGNNMSNFKGNIMETSRSFTFNLPHKDYKILRNIAFNERTTIADLIRVGIVKVIKESEHKEG